jgi:hypothetical protein
MFEPTFDKHIDTQQDKASIIEYCTKYWTINENTEQFKKFVDFLFDYGRNLAKNKFNASAFSLNGNSLIKEEREVMKSKINDVSAIDVYNAKSDILFSGETLEGTLKGGVGYRDYMPNLLKFVRKEFSELKNIKPLNWSKYLKDSSQFEDIEEGVSEDFKGSASSVGIYIWQEFPESISLLTLQYNKERDRNLFESLVGAIVSQGYATEIHNNTVDMLKEVKTIFKKNTEEFDIGKLAPNIKNPTLKAIFKINTYDKKIHKNQEKFEESIGSKLLMPYFTPESIYTQKEQSLAKNKKISLK